MKYVDYKTYRFHGHNAKEIVFNLENGKQQIEFWSYSTPMIIRVDGQVYMNNYRYSNSTARQVRRYLGEERINENRAIFMTEDEMRRLSLY